jgi:hypothetical protein
VNQPTITCPHCEAEITLTESLADPLIRATRKKIAEKEAEVARRESAIGAMCGRLLVGKSKLHVASLVGAAMCSAC